MFEYLIKKVIATDGERDVVESSQEEMHEFIVEGIRPEFDDPHVLCVKFLYCICEDDDEPEETSWFINPEYCPKQLYGSYSAYGPKMDSEFLPELLIMDIPGTDVFKKFASFHTTLLMEGLNKLPEDERYELFLSRLPYIED